MPGNVNAMSPGFANPATGADPRSAAMADGLAKGVAQGFMGSVTGATPIMAGPSARGAAPGASPDPATLAAMQGAKAESDPVGAFFDDVFSDGPGEADPAAALGARGGGPMPGADAAGGTGLEGLPVVAGPNGQAMLMTGQGALPLFMTQQGPMAMTPDGGAVPLQAMAGQAEAAKQQAVQQQAQQVLQQAAVVDAVVKRLAMATSAPAPARTPYSGTSAFVPAKKAPVALSAPPAPAPAVHAETAPTTAKADPKLHRKAGVGTRIGTTGTGDGNFN